MAADSKELQSQLAIQQSINKVLADRQKVMEKQQKYLSSQVDTAVQLCKALECKGLDDVQAKMKEVGEGLRSAAAEAGEAEDKIGGMSKALEDTDKAAKKQIKSWSELVKNIKESNVAIAAFAMGAAKGFKSAVADIKQFASTIGSVVSGITNIGKSILSIPFQMFGGLVGMANNLAASVSVLRQGIEDVRKSFGDLASNEGAALMGGLSNLQSQSSSLGGTGVSLAAVYGVGPGGVAAALADLTDIAGAMGPKFGLLSEEFKNNAGALLAFKKGMGLSSEAMSGFATMSLSAGKSLSSTLQDVGNYSIQMGAKFGISAKLISKDMGDMAKDFKTFGTYSTKEMATASVFARKLGLDMSALQSVAKGFDDFEGAADNVSMLNQAFGMQIDTMEMLNASDAERIELLKDSFAQTGKSFEDLTRQERALLAENAHMTESQLATAFSAENQAVSLDDIASGADEAEDAQLSQTEVMSKLADTMDRVFNSGQNFTGMFDALGQGFTKGLTHQKEFKELLTAIRKALRVVFQAGKELGKLFGDLLGSGGFDILGPLKDMFDGDKLKTLFGGIGVDASGNKTGTGLIGAFDKLMSFLKGDDGVKLSDVFDSVSESFSNFFSANSGAAEKLKAGISRMITGVGEMIAQMIPWVIGKVSDFIKGIADYIRNPPDLEAAASTGIGGALVGALMGIKDALLAAAPVLLNAFLDLIKAVFEQYGGTIVAIGGALLGLVLGKMIIFGAISAVQAAVGAVVIKKLTDFLMDAVGGSADQAEQQLPDPQQVEDLTAAVGRGLASLIDQVAELDKGQIVKAGLKLALIAVMLMPAIGVFALGLVGVSHIMAMASWEGLAKGFVAMLIIIPLLGAIMISAKWLDQGKVAKATLNLAFAAVGMGVGLIAFAIALLAVDAIIGNIPFGRMLKSFAMLGLAILATLAVALVSMLLEPATITTGMTMLAWAGVMAIVGMVAFAGAIWLVNKILGPIPFGKVVENFAMLGMAILATAALAVIALMLVPLAPGFIPATGALLAAVLFFTIGMAAYLFSLTALMSIPQPDLGGVLKMFLTVGSAILATVILAMLTLAATGPMIVGLGPMLLGIGAIAAFFTIGMAAMILALVIVTGLWAGVGDVLSVITMINVIFKIVTALAIIAPLAAIFGLLTPIMPFILWGLASMSTFFVGAALAVGTMIQAAMTIPMSDPEDIANRMEVIGKIAETLQALGGLALDAAKLGLAAEMMGKGGMGEVFAAMSGFLDKIKDTLVSTVVILIGLATGYSTSDLEKAAIVGDVIGAIAKFAGAIAEPLKVVSGMIGFFNPNAAAVMATVVGGLGDIMDMLAQKLPTIINALVSAGAGIPSDFKEKAESMGIMFQALGPMMDALGKMQTIAEASVEGIDGPSVSTLFEGMAGGISALATIMPGVITSLQAIPEASDIQAQIDKLGQLFEVTVSLSDVLGKFTELGNASSPSMTERAGAFLSGLVGGGGGGPTPAAQAILSMVEEMNSINAALEGLPEMNLNASLQSVADAFSVSESINVENKPVNITINLNVTMDANKVGAVLVDKSVMTTPLATAEGQ